MGIIIRAVSADGYIKISTIEATDVVLRAAEIHSLSFTASAALGRTLCCASLLGELLKEDRASLTLRINGGGPIGSLIAVSDSSGNVRGYAQNPHTELPAGSDGRPDVVAAVGYLGLVTVSRDLGLREPYSGSAELTKGDISEDVTNYFSESEQLPAICAVDVLPDAEGGIISAGGYLVQLMPGAPDGHFGAIQENTKKIGELPKLSNRGDAKALVEAVLRGFEPAFLYETKIEYRCNCRRERVLEALSSIGEADLRAMIDSGETARVSCQFCDSVYEFTPEALSEALRKMAAKALDIGNSL